MHARADHPGGAGELLGRGVRAVLQRARVGGQQRQPVGEHVVHLAGDPRPLRDAGLGDAAGLLGLGAAGPLAQRGEQRLPGTVPFAPADAAPPRRRSRSTAHHAYGSDPFGRHTPRIRCAATSAPPTATATAKGRRCATYSVPNVAAGVAAGDSAASTASATAPGTGQRSSTGTRAQATSPTAISSVSSPDDSCELACPTMVAAVSAPIPVVAPAITGSGGDSLTRPG